MKFFGFTLKIIVIVASISLLVLFFHFEPQGNLSIYVDSIVNKEKNLFYLDLSDNPAFSFFVKPNPRMLIYLNGKRLFDRVQLIGQGLVKPELKEIASLDYILSEKRVFVLEGYDLYFSYNRIKNRNDIKSFKATQVKILNPLVFWIPLLILVFFFIHFFYKIPFSIRKMALIMFLLATSCIISMKYMRHFVSQDLEAPNLVKDFLKPAYNLIHHGSYTICDISNDNQKKVKYANKREPLLSFLMAPFIYFDRSYNESNSFKQYAILQYEKFPIFLFLQLFIILAIGTISAYFVYQITGSLLFALLTNIVVSSSPTLTTAALGIRDTNLIALSLLWFSVASYWYFKRKSLFDVFNISLAGSCLILCRASFLFIFPFIYLFLLVVEFRWIKKLNLKKSSIYNILFLLLVLIIVGSWCLRNHVKTGNFSINTYGYGLANVRLCYNDMNKSEFFQSFAAWAPEMTNARWKEIAGSESRFHRNSKNSFRKCQLNSVRRKHSSLSAAMLSVVQNPLKHALTTISLFYKGMFPESWRGRKDSPFFYRSILSGLFHIAMFFSLIYFSLRSFPCLAFSLPTFSFMLFNAFCTNNIQRYNFPVLPVIYVCGLIVLFWVVQNRFQRLTFKKKE